MQIKENFEYEIDLKEAFFHVLYRWRSILAAALLGALLFGGYAYLKNQKAASPDSQVNQAEMSSEEERELTENALAVDSELYDSLLLSSIEYSKNSVLMNADLNQEWQAWAVYSITSSPENQNDSKGEAYPDPAAKIAAAYPTAIWYGWDEEKLAAIYGEEGKKFAKELFSSEAVEGSGTFTIKAIGLTKEMAEQGRQYLEEAVQSFYHDKGQTLGQYQLKKLNEYTVRGVDAEAGERKELLAESIQLYRRAKTDNQTILQDIQTNTGKKSLIKFLLIGFFLGGCCMITIYIILYVLSGKLQNRAGIQENLGVAVFGEFRHSRARHPGKGLDKLIEKWEFKKDRADRETILGNICILIEEKAESEVLLTGTLPQSEILPLCEEIKKRIKSTISVKAEADILNNQKAIDAANRAETIVLVEEKHVSRNKDIRRMAEILSICETPVIGAIIL